MRSTRAFRYRSTCKAQSLLQVLLSLLLLCLLFGNSSASTSSLLLKSGVQKSIQCSSTSFLGHASKRFTTRTGFRSFSQRATRLQSELQKSFSLRAIFSDVITNHPGKQQSRGNSITSGSGSITTTAGQLLQEENFLHMKKGRIPRLQDLQRIAVGTLQESWGGFIGGYTLGISTDITRRLWGALVHGPSVSATATNTAGHVLPFPGLVRHSQQSLQMHSRSTRFGIEWAQMSAVFAASRLLVQTIRQKDDEWNTVAGSSLAGAVFACSIQTNCINCPPAAMARGALLYGGTMFLLHPNLWKQTTNALMLNPNTTSNNNHASTQIPIWDGIQ